MNGDITDERMVFKRGIELIYQPIEQDMEAFGRSLEAFIKLSLGRTECKVDVSPKPSSNIKFGNGIEACSEPKCSGVECPITPQSTRLNLKDVVEEAAPVVKIRLSDFLPGNRLYDAEGGNLDNRNSSKLLRYEFTKDEVYLGEVMDNKAHGHGVLHFRGCQYGGHWENGMERIGCYLWPSGVQYHGTWEAGYRHGNGVEKHATYVYKGEWVKDAKQGYGVASSQTGCMYEGTWKNNRHEGYGVEVYKDGGFYAGQFNQGIRDGHGVRVFHPNSSLKDAFANKTLTDSSSEVPSATDLERLLGDKIFCEFEEGDKTEIYRGQWKNDKREGPGIERDSQGDVYEGHFKDNMRHGYGVLKSKGGRIYYGRWKKNKLIQNNRTSNSSCQKAELSAQEGCSVATRKTWLALSRAHGARRFASWAVHSQREAYKHYALSEEKERDARALVDVGNVGANIVAQKFQEMSPSSIARRGLSKLSDIFSPLPSRKSISSTCSEMEDSPNLSNRRLSNSHRFLKPAS